jgi:hypothetical protein
VILIRELGKERYNRIKTVFVSSVVDEVASIGAEHRLSMHALVEDDDPKLCLFFCPVMESVRSGCIEVSSSGQQA